MENRDPVSPILMWTTLVSFCLMSFGSICVFVFLIILLVNSVVALPPTVVIYKGYYFTLGAGIGLGALLVDGVTVNILKRPLSGRAETLAGRFMVGGLVVAFLLPHLIHYPVAEYLEKKGYHFCEPLSTQWRFVRTISYTQPGYCVERNDEKSRMDQ